MAKRQTFVSSSELGRGHDHVFIEWRALTCPKAEYTPETTEDRYAARASLGLFAVADGVGSSFRAAEWAQAVVDAWVRMPFHSHDAFEVEGWLRKLQKGFDLRPEEIAALQPYAQAQARKGSGCTLLGLRLWPAHDQRSALYSLLCVGDSDLIHYNKGVFPVLSPSQFGSYPTVLRSKAFDRAREKVQLYPPPAKTDTSDIPQARDQYERLSQGETLLLATDALAHWALETDNWASSHHDGEGARAQLERQTTETWPGFIKDLRHAGRIVDDDTTVVFIRIAREQRDGAAPEGWGRVALSASAIEQAETAWGQERRRELDYVARQQPVSAIELARAYGDGWYFQRDKSLRSVAETALEGRRLASNLERINEALRAVSWERPTREQLAAVAELRQKYGERLADEPAAQGALATMRDLLDGAPTQHQFSGPPQAAQVSAPLVNLFGAQTGAPQGPQSSPPPGSPPGAPLPGPQSAPPNAPPNAPPGVSPTKERRQMSDEVEGRS